MKMTPWRTTSWHLMWPSVSLASPQWSQAKRWHQPRGQTNSAWPCTCPDSTSSSGAPRWGLWVRTCPWVSHLCQVPAPGFSSYCCPLLWAWPMPFLWLWGQRGVEHPLRPMCRSVSVWQVPREAEGLPHSIPGRSLIELHQPPTQATYVFSWGWQNCSGRTL